MTHSLAREDIIRGLKLTDDLNQRGISAVIYIIGG